MKRLNTHLIAPFHHQIQRSTKDSYILLSEKGFISLYLGKENSKIHISGDGNRVIVETKSGKHEYKPFDQNGLESGNFPSKLRQWYMYAASFVETLKRK